jgi:hypothetical protein
MTDEELQRYAEKIDEFCVIKSTGLNYGLIVEGSMFNTIYQD